MVIDSSALLAILLDEPRGPFTLLRVAEVEPAPFTAAQLRISIDAFRRFGRGRHPAALNFGDCFSYALAAATGEPLLFKGDDLSRTDIKRVL